MKVRVKTDDGFELSTICRQLKLIATDGKMRETDCTNTQNLLRIIQSIPSPKAEPFKQWLAKEGYEGMQEIIDSKPFTPFPHLQTLQGLQPCPYFQVVLIFF